MNNSNQEECPYCTSYENFKSLVTSGESVEESFHSAVEELIDTLIEDVSDVIGCQAYQDGYNDGFISSLRVAAQDMERTANALVDEIDSKCGDCNCTDECGSDTEKKILRYILEDKA